MYKVQQPVYEPTIEQSQPDKDADEREEGELDDEYIAEIDAKNVNHDDDNQDEECKDNKTKPKEISKIEMKGFNLGDLSGMALQEFFKDAYVQEYPTLYIGLPLD